MLDEHTLSILKSVIYKHLDAARYKAFIFGSRTQPKHRKYCDVDVGIMGSRRLPAETLLQIKEDLSGSDILYLTDVVDFGAVSKEFREKALSSIILL